jgi:hypothetical protein
MIRPLSSVFGQWIESVGPTPGASGKRYSQGSVMRDLQGDLREYVCAWLAHVPKIGVFAAVHPKRRTLSVWPFGRRWLS